MWPADPVCLGCMGFGLSRWRSWVLDEPAALPILDAAIAAGIAMFDTANVYSGGESERILGRFVRSRGLRDRVFIATKLFHDTPDRLGLTGLGRANVIGSAEASLVRLGVERIDLLQIHRWDPDTPIEETLEAFDALIRAGKVARIGASNLAAWQLAKAQIAAARDGLPGFAAVQPHYNLLYREEERDLLPLCADQGIRRLPWSPLARGRLARAADTGATERARQDDVAETLYGDGDGGEGVIAAVRAVAAELGEAPASVALAWLIAKRTTPVFGATRLAHIGAAARAATIALDDDRIARLERPYRPRAPVALPYSARNQAATASLATAADRPTPL